MSGEREQGETHAVSVLGEVTVDGEPVTKRQATIVSVLALSLGRPIDTENLISAVWTEQVPNSARASLQNQITRLRRRFGSGLIRSDRRGYELVATTDVQLFERLVTQGLSETPGDKRALLSEAIEVLDGRPFVVLEDHPCAEHEAARLVALGDRAAESLAKAHMAAGDHDAAVAQLRILLDNSPYDEVCWELLMRAHLGAGRPAEALATFARVSQLLQSDLCATPCADLVALKDAITAGENDVVHGSAEVVDLRIPRPATTPGADVHRAAPIRQRGWCHSHNAHRTMGGAA